MLFAPLCIFRCFFEQSLKHFSSMSFVFEVCIWFWWFMVMTFNFFLVIQIVIGLLKRKLTMIILLFTVYKYCSLMFFFILFLLPIMKMVESGGQGERRRLYWQRRMGDIKSYWAPIKLFLRKIWLHPPNNWRYLPFRGYPERVLKDY